MSRLKTWLIAIVGFFVLIFSLFLWQAGRPAQLTIDTYEMPAATLPLPLPLPHPAPALLEPAAGASFFAGQPVILRWQAVPDLAADEFYTVRLTFQRLGELQSYDVWWQETEVHLVQEDLETDDDKLWWQVTVQRKLGIGEGGEPLWEPTSPPSEQRVLTWR